MDGTCLCGAVRVKVNDPDLFGEKRRGHICRCTNCRKVAGSSAATNLIIETEKVTIDGEENLKEFVDRNTLSGNALSRFFCSTCGNPIKSVTPAFPGKIIIKLGIFPQIPVPEWEAFSSQRQVWETPLSGAIQYKTKTFGEKMDD